MTEAYYQVGRHNYCVRFCDEENTVDLLPSSEPFRMDAQKGNAADNLLFTLSVDDTWHPAVKGMEIGRFDGGDEVFDVCQLDNGGYQILAMDKNVGHLCLLEAEADFSLGTVRLVGDGATRLQGLNTALMLMYAFAAADKMTVLIHASVVRKDGRGYLCLGTSGTGKSTHTANWLRYIEGTDLINDDNPVVRVCEDGVVRVFGSPWSGKTPCYRNVEAPVGGFLQLKQAPYNRIRQMETVEGFVALLSSCSVMKWDGRDYQGVCDTVVRLMEMMPVYEMENLPNEEAVRMSYGVMSGKVEAESMMSEHEDGLGIIKNQ